MSAATSNFVLRVQTRLNQRGERLDLDGVPGPLTVTALDRVLPDLAGPATDSVADLSAQHYALAREYLGLREQPGPGTHPRLVPMFELTPSWLDRDDSKTAWCGIFRGWIGHRAGSGLPPAHYRAAAWAAWGKSVALNKPKTWRQGDTVVMTREGGAHVALLDRVEGASAWCLGGNQSNAVTLACFPLSRITHVRR